jgi:hypothetical protein
MREANCEVPENARVESRENTAEFLEKMPVTKTSWQTGRSGNPLGRPRAGEDLAGILRQTLDRKRFAEKLCELCYAGDVQAMRLLLAYTDGLPIGRAGALDEQGIEGIQVTVTYVQQNNRIELTSASSGASEIDPGIEAVQRAVLWAPVGQDGVGDGPADSPLSINESRRSTREENWYPSKPSIMPMRESFWPHWPPE